MSLLNLMQSLADQDDHHIDWIDLQARRSKYGVFEPLNQYDQFQETILLHHMAPNHPDLTLSVGMRPVKSASESDSSSDDEVADERNPAHENLKRRRTGESKRKGGNLGREKFKRNVRYAVCCIPGKHYLLIWPSVLPVRFHNADCLGFSYSDTLVIPQLSKRLCQRLGTSVCGRRAQQDRDVQIKAPSPYQSRK